MPLLDWMIAFCATATIFVLYFLIIKGIEKCEGDPDG
jgi:hypothetical protein